MSKCICLCIYQSIEASDFDGFVTVHRWFKQRNQSNINAKWPRIKWRITKINGHQNSGAENTLVQKMFGGASSRKRTSSRKSENFFDLQLTFPPPVSSLTIMDASLQPPLIDGELHDTVLIKLIIFRWTNGGKWSFTMCLLVMRYAMVNGIIHSKKVHRIWFCCLNILDTIALPVNDKDYFRKCIRMKKSH